MVGVAESLGNTQMNAEFVEGLNQLSGNQTITFTKYYRVVLPVDGCVFWVKADLLSPSTVFNASRLNEVPLNKGSSVSVSAPTVTIQGSLHYAVNNLQSEDESFSVSRVVFTTATEIQDLTSVTANVMYIGELVFPPPPAYLEDNPASRHIRFAFSRQSPYYSNAGLFHYEGDAIYPAMESQIIDRAQDLDLKNPVISNSLPLWLALAQADPQPWQPPRQMFPVYPSYAVPDNLPPPYASVHIVPEGTQALGAAPLIDGTSSHFQLAQDKVRITFYGLRNDAVQDFMDAVNQYSLDTDNIGIMNMPIVRDAKRPQVELGVLAQKKVAEFEVSYYQTRVNDVARQLIKSVIPSYLLQ